MGCYDEKEQHDHPWVHLLLSQIAPHGRLLYTGPLVFWKTAMAANESIIDKEFQLKGRPYIKYSQGIAFVGSKLICYVLEQRIRSAGQREYVT